MKGRNNGIRLEILADDSVASIGSLTDFQPPSDADWLDIFQDSDTSFAGDDDPSASLGSFSTEEGILGSFDTSSPPDQHEEHGFSFTIDSAQETKKGVIPREFEDFDDYTMQWTALSIYQAIQLLHKTLSCPTKSKEVFEWFFSSQQDQEEHEVTFDDCCNAHGARTDVVRMRIMFELWRFERFATAPYDLTSYEMPDFISTTIFFEYGVNASRIARLLWQFPGATVEQLSEYASDDEIATLEDLADAYIVSPSYGKPERWYLTGINPILKSDEQIRPTLNRQKHIEMSWARYFPYD